MAGADGVVVEVVRRRDLHAAGSELRIHVFVRDHGNPPPHQRQHHGGAHQRAVAGVVRMHGHRGVAEHGLRARGGDNHMVFAVVGAGAVRQWIAEVPEVAALLHVLHFQIRNGGAQLRIPVHQALAAVDEPLLEEPHEHFQDGARETLVHGEAFARPVHRRPHAAYLAGNAGAGAALPLPDLVDERVASQIRAAHALRQQLPLHHHLRGYLGVVGAGLPQGSPPLHPVVADEGVHQRVLKRMPDVEPVGDVRRRNDDAVRRAVAARREVAGAFPLLVQRAFNGARVEGAVHAGVDAAGARVGHSQSSSS